MTDIDWDLLFRYAGNECSAEERGRFEAWLESDRAHRAFYDATLIAAGRTLERMPASRPLLRVAAARRPAPARVSWMAAAALLMIVAGSTLVWRTVGQRTGSSTDSGAAMHVATTARGERATLHLSDGTLVMLGAASTLRYPADLTGSSRDVYLVGEGYFEVSHDARRPFRVHAGGATAEDLGTEFGVRAYAGDSSVRVVVAEGKVSLGAATSDQAHAAVLTRGELGRLTTGSSTASVQRVDVDAYLGWTKGRLVFDEAPLAEVTAQLGRWYAVELRIADSSIASRRLTATFTNEPLAEVLAALAPALDVRFERRGDTVEVRPRGRDR